MDLHADEAMTCDKCGAVLSVSDWPFCPHERGVGKYFQDAVPGGFTVENGFEQPTTFYSHSEHRAALAARGLTIGAKWAGEHDKHLKRWDVPCAATLESAKTLLSRRKGTPFAPEEFEPVPIEVSTVTFEKDA